MRHLVLLCALCSVLAAETTKPLKRARYLMGTLCVITAYPEAPRRNATEAAIAASFAEIKRIDDAISSWKTSSELMQLNAAAARNGNPRPQTAVSQELFRRVVVALSMARETDGLFDPTVGPLVRYWGFLPKKGQLERLEDVRKRVGWKKVRVNASHGTVQFEVARMELDFGGIGKGYAAARAAQVLREHGVTSAIVSLGGSSIVAIGDPPGKAGWQVAIKDPRDGRSAYAELSLQDGEALATSGTYEKRHGNRSHLVEPLSGQALTTVASVTVVFRDAEVADALTKPFILLGTAQSAEASRIALRFPDASVLVLAQKGERLLASTSRTMKGRVRYLQDAIAAR